MEKREDATRAGWRWVEGGGGGRVGGHGRASVSGAGRARGVRQLAVVSCAASWPFMTSGSSGGDDSGVMSTDSKSPVSVLVNNSQKKTGFLQYDLQCWLLRLEELRERHRGARL